MNRSAIELTPRTNSDCYPTSDAEAMALPLKRRSWAVASGKQIPGDKCRRAGDMGHPSALLSVGMLRAVPRRLAPGPARAPDWTFGPPALARFVARLEVKANQARLLPLAES